MSHSLSSVLKILDLEQLEQNLFRGLSPNTTWQRVYGGQVIGQALVAATRTCPERPVHSLHCYFLRPGDPQRPIIYQVERVRDGGSFSTRRVIAIQHGKPIFTMTASFHAPEEGLAFQIPMENVPMPEDLPTEDALKARMIEYLPERVRDYWEKDRPIEMRPVDLERYMCREPNPKDPNFDIWMRATGTLPEDPSLHQCILAYASDMTLLDTAVIAHGKSIFDEDLMAASLDHAIWFHRPFKADEWLLYAQTSPSTFSARGISFGRIFNRNGDLVASVAQEGLIRQTRST